MRAVTTLVLVAALAMVSEGHADGCDRNAPQIDLNACADQAFERSDAALNVVYGQVMARLRDDARTKRLLTIAEKAWLDFRDLECVFATSGSVGSTTHPMVVAKCRSGLTAARTSALEAYLQCPHDASACPLPPP